MSNVTIIDSRVQAARDLVADLRSKDNLGYAAIADIIEGVLVYAQGRLDINVGLISENSSLKQRLAEKPGEKEMSDQDLIRLMQERGLLVVTQ